MYSRILRSANSVEPNLTKHLIDVLTEYHQRANSDPSELRSLIPSNEVWRFFIDGVLQDLGWRDFETREAGYTAALYNGFNEIFNLSAELNPELIERYHSIATSGVSNTNYGEGGGKGSFRMTEERRVTGFYIGTTAPRHNVTIAGLTEFFDRADPQLPIAIKFPWNMYSTTFKDFVLTSNCIKAIRGYISSMPDLTQKSLTFEDIKYDLSNYFYDDNVANNVLSFGKQAFTDLIVSIGMTTTNAELANSLHTAMTKATWTEFQVLITSVQSGDIYQVLTQEVLSRIATFNLAMKSAKTPMKKLSAIVTFIRSCEQLHPFADANCRTFCMLLSNHLLLKFGFPLAIFANPNRFEGFSHNEMLQNIIEGMQNTFTLIKTQQLFNVSTSKLVACLGSDKERKYFSDCVAHEDACRVRPIKRMKLTN